MGSAPPELQPSYGANSQPLDLMVLVAEVDASRERMTIVESGKLIYSKRSFAQLSAESDGLQAPTGHGTRRGVGP